MTCLIAPSLPAASMPWKDQEQRPPILGVELLLHVGEHLGAHREQLARVGLRLDPARVARVRVLEPELVPLPHVVAAGQAGELLDDLSLLHGRGSLVRNAGGLPSAPAAPILGHPVNPAGRDALRGPCPSTS